MAAATFHAAGAGAYVAGGSVTTIAVPYPTVTASDVILMHLEEKGLGFSFETPTNPSGWTALYASDYLDTGGNARTWVWSKIATGSESGSLTVTSSDLHNSRAARMYSFTGASGSVEGGNIHSDNGATYFQPDLVTTDVDRFGVALVATDRTVTAIDFTGETGGNFAEATAEYSPGALTMQLQTATLATATTVTGGTFVAAAAAYNVRVFALLPTGGSPPATGSYLNIPTRGIG